MQNTVSSRIFCAWRQPPPALSATSLSAFAADRTIKVGTLKLIHGITPYFYEKFAPAGIKVRGRPV